MDGVSFDVTDYWQESAGTPGKAIASCNVPALQRVECPLFAVISKNQSAAAATTMCQAGQFANCAFGNGGSEVLQYATETRSFVACSNENSDRILSPLQVMLSYILKNAGIVLHMKVPPCFQCKTQRYTGYDFAAAAVDMIANHTALHQEKPLFLCENTSKLYHKFISRDVSERSLVFTLQT